MTEDESNPLRTKQLTDLFETGALDDVATLSNEHLSLLDGRRVDFIRPPANNGKMPDPISEDDVRKALNIGKMGRFLMKPPDCYGIFRLPIFFEN